MVKITKEKIDYKFWFVVLLGYIMVGIVGAGVAALGYYLVDRHNKNKAKK